MNVNANKRCYTAEFVSQNGKWYFNVDLGFKIWHLQEFDMLAPCKHKLSFGDKVLLEVVTGDNPRRYIARIKKRLENENYYNGQNEILSEPTRVLAR